MHCYEVKHDGAIYLATARSEADAIKAVRDEIEMLGEYAEPTEIDMAGAAVRRIDEPELSARTPRDGSGPESLSGILAVCEELGKGVVFAGSEWD
jgi:hypothetical protein